MKTITDGECFTAVRHDPSMVLPSVGFVLHRRYGSMYVDTDVVVLQDPLAPPYVHTSFDVQVTVPRRGSSC